VYQTKNWEKFFDREEVEWTSKNVFNIENHIIGTMHNSDTMTFTLQGKAIVLKRKPRDGRNINVPTDDAMSALRSPCPEDFIDWKTYPTDNASFKGTNVQYPKMTTPTISDKKSSH